MSASELIDILRLDEWTNTDGTWSPPGGAAATIFAAIGAESMSINDVVSLRQVGELVRLTTARKETYTLRASALAVIRRGHR
jgi:hypothetical protein